MFLQLQTTEDTIQNRNEESFKEGLSNCKDVDSEGKSKERKVGSGSCEEKSKIVSYQKKLASIQCLLACIRGRGKTIRRDLDMASVKDGNRREY